MCVDLTPCTAHMCVCVCVCLAPFPSEWHDCVTSYGYVCRVAGVPSTHACGNQQGSPIPAACHRCECWALAAGRYPLLHIGASSGHLVAHPDRACSTHRSKCSRAEEPVKHGCEMHKAQIALLLYTTRMCAWLSTAGTSPPHSTLFHQHAINVVIEVVTVG